MKEKVRKWLPFLINYFELVRNKRRYPGREIHSNLIANDVIIGKKCYINRDVQLMNGVKIGDFSYTNEGTKVGIGTEIGKYCSISYNCQIGLFDHPIKYISSHPRTFGVGNVFDNEVKFSGKPAPIIENDVWIGGNSTILRGTKIHNGAIIGAGAVVTKDVPPYAIVGGVPARIIKYRFERKAIDFLEGLKWWDLPDHELQKYKQLFDWGDKWVNHIPE